MSGLYVFLGGGAGSVLRWLVSGSFAAPWGTVCVNILGSFLLAALLHPGHSVSDPIRLAVGVGMMGGFTTYSTFNLDVLQALHAGAWSQAATTIVVTLVACLVGGGAGFAFGEWMASGPA